MGRAQILWMLLRYHFRLLYLSLAILGLLAMKFFMKGLKLILVLALHVSRFFERGAAKKKIKDEQSQPR